MASILDTVNQRYQVTFYEREEPLNRITAWLGDAPPTPSGGGGGYETLPLPLRSAVSVWRGRSGLLVQDIPIMLWKDEPEVFASGKKGTAMRPASTAEQARRLIAMWRPDDDTQAPPIIRVSAPNNLVPYTSMPFWISDFTWGAAIGSDDAKRTMQQLVIQVTEYRADEQLQTDKAKKPKKKGRQRTYVVRAGDTLTSIARKYHLDNGWRQLGNAQHPKITDPRQIRVGQKLVIPANT